MLRSILFLTALLCLGMAPASPQSPLDLFSKAPPDVDEALRARIATFYKAHVDGKPRRAEEVIAEDSRDYFYDSRKPKLLSYEIREVKYSDDFTKAKAVVLVEQYIAAPGFGNKPMKVPVTTLWKIVDGKWYWYITEDVINTTPFGKVGTAPASPATTATGSPQESKPVELPAIRRLVKADKNSVELKLAEHSSDQVTVENQMRGPVKLEVRGPKVAGLEVSLHPSQLKAGEKSIVAFEFTPQKEVRQGPIRVVVLAHPSNSVIPLQVNFR